MGDALPFLPAPTPLHHAAMIEYQWGVMKFEIVATACSLRTTAWGDEQVTWLHCIAKQTAKIKPDEPTSFIAALIPVHYVTSIQPGPTFRIARSRRCDDVGVFPPNQLTPADALPLAEVERVITELLAPERN